MERTKIIVLLAVFAITLAFGMLPAFAQPAMRAVWAAEEAWSRQAGGWVPLPQAAPIEDRTISQRWWKGRPLSSC